MVILLSINIYFFNYRLTFKRLFIMARFRRRRRAARRRRGMKRARRRYRIARGGIMF